MISETADAFIPAGQARPGPAGYLRKPRNRRGTYIEVQRNRAQRLSASTAPSSPSLFGPAAALALVARNAL